MVSCDTNLIGTIGDQKLSVRVYDEIVVTSLL